MDDVVIFFLACNQLNISVSTTQEEVEKRLLERYGITFKTFKELCIAIYKMPSNNKSNA